MESEEMKRERLKKEQRALTRNKNVNKWIRLGNACKNPHERRSHYQKADMLIKRYESNPIA